MKNKFPIINVFDTGQNIKRIMRMKRMTVKEVQEYLGLAAPQSIYHWFAGRSIPTVDNLYALSELFCVPMDALVCGTREKKFYFYNRSADRRLVMYYKKCLALYAAG